jgi:hypothetical protein
MNMLIYMYRYFSGFRALILPEFFEIKINSETFPTSAVFLKSISMEKLIRSYLEVYFSNNTVYN